MAKVQKRQETEDKMRATILSTIERLEAIQKGEIKSDGWQCPFIAEGSGQWPVNAEDKPYDGIFNGINLMSAQHKHGYTSNKWITFNHAKKNGITITDAKEYSWVFFSEPKTYVKENPTTGEEETKSYWFIKTFHLYNMSNTDQAEGKEDKPKHINPDERITEIDEFASKTNAKIIEKNGGSAHYSPSKDEIVLPEYAQFKSAIGFAQTKLHELIHWTGHKDRLDRHRKGITFGSSEYAFEELIAELGSAVSLYRKGYQPSGVQHEEYIISWLKALKNDPKVLFKAGAKAGTGMKEKGQLGLHQSTAAERARMSKATMDELWK